MTAFREMNAARGTRRRRWKLTGEQPRVAIMTAASQGQEAPLADAARRWIERRSYGRRWPGGDVRSIEPGLVYMTLHSTDGTRGTWTGA